MNPRLRPRPRAVILMACALGACSGGGAPSSPSTPAPSTSPVVVSTPATPVPTPTPGDECTQGLCEEPVSNRSKAARVTLRLYWVTDGQGARVNLTLDDDIPIGYILRIDATAKDAEGKETLGKNPIQWFFVNEQLGRVGGIHSHQRRVTVKAPGNMFVHATLDGVTSNELWLRFR